MGARPLRRQKPSSWCLLSPHDDNTQGLVVNGFGSLESGRALFLEFGWADNSIARKGEWLTVLKTTAELKNGKGIEDFTQASERSPTRAVNIAFTSTGLKKLGLSEETLATFSAPFLEGMYQEDRLRRLGDKIRHEWQDTVIAGGPRWSGNIETRQPPRVAPRERSFRDVGPHDRDEESSPTPVTVHALLLLYYSNADAGAADWSARIVAALAPHGIAVVHELPLDLRKDGNFPREHFGFADGVSQPVPYDERATEPDAPPCVAWNDGQAMTRDPVHGVPLGEILIGHINGHHEKAPGPIVSASDPEAMKALDPAGAPEGFLNLGIDGSYMVVRELRQNVAAFWESMEAAAAAMDKRDPKGNKVAGAWLAERVVGRTRDGDILRPAGKELPRDEDDQPTNGFRFRIDDPYGFGCPLGSHVRRANPRDSLADLPHQEDTLLDAANNHRILRRGRKYGATLAPPYKDDGIDRGLLFICLNTDIARQFEFVQQTWLLNSNFHTLFDETDPLVGPKGPFTLPEDPLRRRVAVETFIKLAGGEYFFLPSIAALNYLALK